MSRHAYDVIVIGGSAGAVGAVVQLVGALPAELPAALFVVLHRVVTGSRPEGLTEVIASRAALHVQSARDELPIQPGHVYVGPADQHMVLQNGLIRLERSPMEHRYRPGIDPLFKSAASTYGRRVAAVLLSGAYCFDGSAGLWQIKHRGGVTIVQDPRDAQMADMPQNAIDSVAIDHVLPLAEIAPKLIALTARDAAAAAARKLPRVLIVEDESVVASNLQESLSQMGYHVIDWVPTGEAAIELAQRERPDVVLMDIHLAGGLSGVETARRIWQTLQIPVVYCTAHADLETLEAVHTTESYGYIVKPFQSSAVRAALELALARREKELR